MFGREKPFGVNESRFNPAEAGKHQFVIEEANDVRWMGCLENFPAGGRNVMWQRNGLSTLDSTQAFCVQMNGGQK